MKAILHTGAHGLAHIAILLAASTSLIAQEPGAPVHEATGTTSTATPLTSSAAAQAEAVAKYPELGKAGSPFHREFLRRVERARTEQLGLFDNPAWPLILADEVARALPPLAVIPAAASAPINWYAGYSADTFGKLPAALQKLDRQAIDHALLSAAIFHATNASRRAQGLPPLVYLPALREAAWEHSRDMATMGFFSHENPKNPARATPSLRLEAAGLTNMAIGENISKLGGGGHTYWSYARAVLAQWMKSPGHRANILGTRYTHLGCGAHPCGCPAFHLLATQNFAFVAGSARGAPGPLKPAARGD